MKTLSIDIETYSDVPISKTGVYRYCESPDFEILLFGYSVDSGPVQVVDLACGEKIPAEIIVALEDESVIKWAFNASFERICLSKFLGYPTGEYLDSESWRCSMIWAATMCLPLSLEGVGAVLGLEKQKLTEGKDLTKLENPNSVLQMKRWLSDNGVETDSLDKKAIAELLKNASDKLASVLILRQQLAKSSVRKYQTMEKTVCADGRARGMFQFYGANRTGRFSGRNIQLQNLPQNHLPDLADARALVRSGNFDAVSLLYEDVPDTLSQLIRTAFIPREGMLPAGGEG